MKDIKKEFNKLSKQGKINAYSVRGLLVPEPFTLELAKMQKRTLNRCLATLSDNEKERVSKIILERL